MPVPGPWKTNPNLLAVVGFPYIVDFSVEGLSHTIHQNSIPTALLSDPFTHTAALSGLTGNQAGQASLADDWFLWVALAVIDLAKLINLQSPTPDTSLSNPAFYMPPAADTTDPDYIAGGWTGIEYEAPAGTLDVAAGIDVDFAAEPTFGSDDDMPTAGGPHDAHIDVLRLTTSEYSLTYGTDPNIPTGYTAAVPAVADARWGSAVSMPYASGAFNLTEHFDYTDPDAGRRLGFAHRYLGSTWWSPWPPDFNYWQTSGVQNIRAYYRSPRFRLLYPGTPPLRQRQRPTGIGAGAGPALRQRGTFGDGEPPLRQRSTL